MNMCVANCCPLRNKLTYVLDHVTEHKNDIVVVTESWFSSDDSNNRVVFKECLDHGYKLVLVGKEGVLLIKNSIYLIQEHHPQRSFEYIELLITTVSIYVRVVVIYCTDLPF